MSDGFSTMAVAPGERVEFWREMVRRHFVPLRIEPLTAGGFDGAVRLRSIADLDFARVQAHPMQAARGWHHIERSASDEYFIGLHLRGFAIAHQDGRRATLLPADFALFDSGRPYRIEFRGARPFDHLIVRVPRAQLDCRCAHLERATSVPIKAATHPGWLVSSSLRSLAAFDDGASFVDPILDLLGSALAQAAGLVATPVPRRERTLRELKRYALTHLGDADLSPARVASACFVSVRQLHRLFAHEQTSFGAFLKESRLSQCRRDLADPQLATLTIAEIAGNRGFRSAAVFTRAFTQRYGSGPRASRHAARLRQRA
jgi:AraC-like DNA-binding protein